uniref:Solute carrier family 30 member 6 n=1 Tax=Electrophorus electricus TaxID=8005 RepID=A0A4W4HEN5_ELEEL
MERSVLRFSKAHTCLLAFTSALLLCEIVVGRLCKSLINTVDSFHTLSVLVLLPEAAGTTPAASEGARYSVLRLRPFGALVSDLLLACLCVSFLLEILSHTLQPRPIRRPLLATVVGAVSLLFNGLMLVWRRGRGTDAGSDGSSTSPPAIQYNHFNTTKNKGMIPNILLFISYSKKNTVFKHFEFLLFVSYSEASGSMLMFCNLRASNVSRPPASGWCNQDSSRTGQQWQDIIWRTVTMIQGLLASVLVLVNGLLPLTLGPDCLPSLWGCHLLMYMDPGFSTLTVLVLLVGTLPELRRYGLVLLQACPAHVHAQELSAHVGRVSGVIAVHELHVWQLSALQLVASVHVHCLSGLGPLEYSGLLTAVTDVLKGFGLSHCTVQLEFLESASSQGAEQTPCSLHCGEKCAKMMCCSPPQEQSCSTVPSSMDVEVKQQDIVVENTYLTSSQIPDLVRKPRPKSNIRSLAG